jgi:hypothetical protein
MKKLECYHGTSKKNWEKIKRENKFKKSDKGWFGTGAYFYLGSPIMAHHWCDKKYGSEKYSILKVCIGIDENFIFDIRDPLGRDNIFFQEIRKLLIMKLEIDRIVLEEKRKYFENIVLNLINKEYNKKLVMANSFTYDNNKYGSIGVASRVPNGTEICVFDTNIIPINEVKEYDE